MGRTGLQALEKRMTNTLVATDDMAAQKRMGDAVMTVFRLEGGQQSGRGGQPALEWRSS